MTNDGARFRPEIAGLRAIAVAAVVLCHLKVAGFDGGFVGVDVFFVISGYLITRNILTGIDARDFSFFDFYLRRAARILPALIFTVIATYIAGLLWLPPDSLRELAKESTHALLSIANIQYWREAKQYFAPTAEQLPLLHCWSLSLEEQFYLIWPALLVLAARLRSTGAAIALAALASLAASLIVARTDLSATFFLMPFRIVEFAIGGLTILAGRGRMLPAFAAESLTLAGLAAIGLPIALYTDATPFPGLAALLPCFGAAAIILGGSRTRSAALLTNGPARAVGAISYSLYLCHWPLIFFARYIFGAEAMGGWTTLVLLALMLACATAMVVFVELPFRRTIPQADCQAQRRRALRYAACIAILVGLTHTTFMQRGFSWRIPPEAQRLTELQSFAMRPCAKVDGQFCVFGALDAPLGVQLLGDSFIQHYVAALDPLLKQLHLRGEALTLGGCTMLVGLLPTGPRRGECEAAKADAFARIAQNGVNVILGQWWDNYTIANTASTLAPSADAPERLRLSLAATLEELLRGDRRVLVVGHQVMTNCGIDRTRLLPGPLPHAPQLPCAALSRETVRRANAATDTLLGDVVAQWPSGRAALFKPVDYFCDEECPNKREGLWLYEEAGGHFTVAGAQYLGARADAVFREFLGTRATR